MFVFKEPSPSAAVQLKTRFGINMKNLIIAFCISIFLHTLIFYLVFRPRKAERPPVRAVAISLYPESYWTVRDVVSVQTPTEGTRSVPFHAGFSEQAGSLPPFSGDATVRPGSETGIVGLPVPKPLIPLRSPFVQRETASRSRSDSLVRNRVSEWFSGMDFSGIKAFPDAVENQMYKKPTGIDIPGLVSRLFSTPPKKEEKNEVQFDFFPSETHVQAMAALYKKGKATQKDLYLELDPAVPMTAEFFNGELDFLVQKGFMTRKKISPENIFGIATPFGVIPIEMSRKNRLNPVYEYKSQVDQGKLLAFLQSHEFLLKERMRASASADSAGIRSLVQKCEKEMRILTK
jgi:hypothetical protein